MAAGSKRKVRVSGWSPVMGCLGLLMGTLLVMLLVVLHASQTHADVQRERSDPVIPGSKYA
jgi:hypothetical protein